MQVSVETTSGLERKLTIAVPASKVDDVALDKMKELAKTQRLKGFRPGKIPLNVIKKQFGKHVRQDVINDVMQRSFYEAVMQEKLQPAGVPKIEAINVDEGKDLEFTAIFDIYPEPKITDFKKLSVEKLESSVSDDDLNKMIGTLCEQQADWVESKGKAKEKDQVIIDFKGTIDKEAFAGGSANDFAVVLGTGQMIPGFEDQLTGCKAGDSLDIKVTFPEDYQSQEVAGKKAVFETLVKTVNSKKNLSQKELAEKLGIEKGDVDAMKADIRKNMERELSQSVQGRVKEAVMSALVDAHDFDIPASMVEGEIEQLKAQAMQQFGGAQGGNLPDLPSELFQDRAERRVKLGLLLSEIIKQNDLRADSAQVKSRLEELASVYEQPEEVVNYYMSDKNRLAEIEQLVLEDSVIDFVLSSAKVKVSKLSFDEVMNPGKQADKPAKKSTSKKASKKKETGEKTTSKKATSKKASKK
ncbi:MAG: trigger factor [Gammaproteobacteria bacterium]|nr:trigger factor [Gammaproteobacteria bacterium]